MSQQRDDEVRWEKRIERAKQLAKDHPSAFEILGFYTEIASFQKSLLGHLRRAFANGKELREDVPFRDCLDLTPVLGSFPAFLSLVERVGPPVVAAVAKDLARAEHAYWQYLLSSFWAAEAHAVDGAPQAQLFFAQAFLQPYAEFLARRRKIELPRFGPPFCPVCSGKPQVGVLREEGHGAKRSLVCSLCLIEWDYRRVMCPACGEDRFDALPVYTADQFDYVRVEACDTCKTYIKAVDLTKDGLAIPVVDELATISLNLWAEEKGYTKLQRNLLGL